MKGEPAAFDAALGHCLAKLRQRDLLEAELADSLALRNYPPEVVEQVLTWLREKGLVNDRRAIIAYAATFTGRRARGSQAVRRALIERGAPQGLIDECLGEDTPRAEELSKACEALSAKFGERKDRARAGRFLESRGFEEGLVELAVEIFCGCLESNA